MSIAAINGPRSLALSGRRGALGTVLDQLRADGVDVRPLAVPVAAHSPQVDPILDAFEAVAASVTYHEPTIEVISGMTGRPAEGAELRTAAYWRQHLRQPVRFADAFLAVHERGIRVFLEVGPHPMLVNMGRHLVDEHECEWLASLRSGHGDWRQLLDAVARLHACGGAVEWAAFDAPFSRTKVALPTYPFQRERYWAESAAAPSRRRRLVRAPARRSTRPDAWPP